MRRPLAIVASLPALWQSGCSSGPTTTAPPPPHVEHTKVRPPQSQSQAMQAHLSFIGHRGMRVSFQVLTPGGCVGAVWYGSDPLKLDMLSQEESRCSYISSGSHVHIELTALEASATYHYQIGMVHPDTGAVCSNPKSEVRSFTTAQAPNDHRGHSVQIFGDMGYDQKYGHAKMSHDLMMRTQNETDWYFHVGDIGYQDNAFLRLDSDAPQKLLFEDILNDYTDWMEPITATHAYMVLPGNHESECHSAYCLTHPELRSGLGNFTAYNCRFRMPSKESKGAASMWYSFDYGGVHYVAMNGETDFPGADEEHFGGCSMCEIPAGSFGPKGAYLEWLKADLEAAHANRDAVPWVVGLAHRPLHTTDSNVKSAFTLSHEALINDYTDLFVAGHVHYYSRMVARNGSHAVLVVPGGTGCDEWQSRDVKTDSSGDSDKWHSFMNYGSQQSVGRLTVLPGAAEIEYVQMDSASGAIIDKIRLRKDLSNPKSDNQVEVVPSRVEL